MKFNTYFVIAMLCIAAQLDAAHKSGARVGATRTTAAVRGDVTGSRTVRRDVRGGYVAPAVVGVPVVEEDVVYDDTYVAPVGVTGVATGVRRGVVGRDVRGAAVNRTVGTRATTGRALRR